MLLVKACDQAGKEVAQNFHGAHEQLYKTAWCCSKVDRIPGNDFNCFIRQVLIPA